MTTILYEHPLNERIRNYLKLEQLFTQVSACFQHSITANHNTFFTSLFAIIDTLERNDVRGDLIKDLEKLEQNLVIWSQIPEVDNTIIEENLRDTVAFSSQLKKTSPQWLKLKDNKFLTGLKQRFAIQGGNSHFDLPQLQFWLNQPIQQIEQEARLWLSHLQQVHEALVLILKFTRQRAKFETIATENGFYQDSGEGLVLLRVKLEKNISCYPTISGNRFRYSIRFALPCEESGRKYTKQALSFQLAKC